MAMTRPLSSACGEKNAAKAELEHLSGNLVVQLGVVTETLNRL
jgi:hypothetical protein